MNWCGHPSFPFHDSILPFGDGSCSSMCVVVPGNQWPGLAPGGRWQTAGLGGLKIYFYVLYRVQLGTSVNMLYKSACLCLALHKTSFSKPVLVFLYWGWPCLGMWTYVTDVGRVMCLGVACLWREPCVYLLFPSLKSVQLAADTTLLHSNTPQKNNN